MNGVGSATEARKSLFAKQASIGGLNGSDGEGAGCGGLMQETINGCTTRGVGQPCTTRGPENTTTGKPENIGEERNLFTEGIFALSCRGEVEKVR